MNKARTILIPLVVAALVLASCRPATPAAPTPTQMDANAVYTAAAQTAESMMTEIAARTPTPEPATATPTITPEPPTPTATQQPSPTTGAAAATQTAPPASSGADRADFVADVTIPDGTSMDPGESFVKTWRIQNTGTTTWSTSYSLKFASGAQMGGPASVPLTAAVGPGQTVEISVPMTAPAEGGAHRGYWRMANAAGQLFNTPVYVDILVSGSGTAAATVTPGGPTLTPTTTQAAGSTTPTATTQAAGSAVSSVSMSVDSNNYEGACPHTFVFTGEFTLNRRAEVTYKIEMGSTASGFNVTLPDPVTSTYDPGTYSVVYPLDFNGNFTAWARLHITAPEDETSNQVTVTLACQ